MMMFTLRFHRFGGRHGGLEIVTLRTHTLGILWGQAQRTYNYLD
jgi:hypothetical protein